MDRNVDVVIIGAGSAGFTAFREARKVTDNVILVNEGPYGETCDLVGCMPSKILIAIAGDFARRRVFAEEGILGSEHLRIHSDGVLAHIRRLRDHFVQEVQTFVETLGTHKVPGRAEFIDATTLKVGADIVHTKSTIVATGSRPVLPPAWAALAPRVVTTDTIFEIAELPKSMAVIGLGAIGVELGQSMARLGVKVIGIERSRHICGTTDPAIMDATHQFMKQDFEIWSGVESVIAPLDNGKLQISGGPNGPIEVDMVLASLGRRPNLARLGLEKLGIDLSTGTPRCIDGTVCFNPETTQLGELPIFLAGDVSAFRPIVHEAMDDGLIAGYNAARSNSRAFRRRVPLRIAFTDPQVAIVGAAHDELPPGTFVIAPYSFQNQPKAIAISRNRGQINIYARKSDGIILGSEMAAPGGEHLAFALAMAIEKNMTVRELLSMPFYHPTIEEGISDALLKVVEKQNGSGFETFDLYLDSAAL